MVNDVLSYFYFSLHRRLSSIAVVTVCILCSYPQICMAMDESASREFVKNIVSSISDSSSDHLIETFGKLEESLQSTIDPLDQIRNFLHLFIEEINAKYGFNLTIYDACILIRNNLAGLNLSTEDKNIILQTIALFESDSKLNAEKTQQFENISKLDSVKLNISLPWNWFSPKKKQHKNHKQNSLAISSVPSLQAINPENELPGAVCAEILAGALICILGPVFPPAYGIGGGLIIDGISRTLRQLQN
jgi:hypothetical protein